MAATKTLIAPDSAAELHDLIGDDATATFESDPKFIYSDPTDDASSENIEFQRDTDDTADSEEEEEELDELEDDEDEDEVEDEDDEEDEEDKDDDDDEDEEDEDEDEDEEDEDIDDEEIEEEEDDEEEVGAIMLRATGSTNVRSPVKIAKTTVKKVLEEEDAGDVDEGVNEGVDEDKGVNEGVDEGGKDSTEPDRAIGAMPCMGARVAVASEFTANV
jgi:hypothetical protein